MNLLTPDIAAWVLAAWVAVPFLISAAKRIAG